MASWRATQPQASLAFLSSSSRARPSQAHSPSHRDSAARPPDLPSAVSHHPPPAPRPSTRRLEVEGVRQTVHQPSFHRRVPTRDSRARTHTREREARREHLPGRGAACTEAKSHEGSTRPGCGGGQDSHPRQQRPRLVRSHSQDPKPLPCAPPPKSLLSDTQHLPGTLAIGGACTAVCSHRPGGVAGCGTVLGPPDPFVSRVSVSPKSSALQRASPHRQG